MIRKNEIIFLAAVFIAALLITFPRRQALEFLLNRVAQAGKLELSYSAIKPTLLGASLDKLTLEDSQQKQSFQLEKIKLAYLLFWIKAEARAGNGEISLTANPLGIKYQLSKFPAPPQLSRLLGNSEIDLTGDLALPGRTGKADFKVLSRQLPAPFTGSEVSITGTAHIKKTQLAIDFQLSSSQIKGQGNLTVDLTQKLMPVDGKIEINLGNATLNYLLKGNLNNLEVLPEIPSGRTSGSPQERGFNQ